MSSEEKEVIKKLQEEKARREAELTSQREKEQEQLSTGKKTATSRLEDKSKKESSAHGSIAKEEGTIPN